MICRGRLVSRRLGLRLLPVIVALAMALPGLSAADLLEQTQPLRTALHKDPTLDAPLDRLVDAWRSAGRIQELIGVYTEHLATYPEDHHATVVLIRLELAAGDPAAMSATEAAVAAYPDDAYVWYLRSRSLSAARDGGSLDALDKAVTLETAPWRKRTWAERLVDEALKSGRPELARRHLAAAAGGDDSPAGRLATARRQAQAGQSAEALASLTGIRDAEPELAVEIDLVAAEQEAALKQPAAAAKRLDAVLLRLAADHWRRGEVLRRRIELAAEGAEREALLAAAKARAAAAPGDDAAVIDQARLLTATDRRQEALAALVAAFAHAPTPRLEGEVLAAFDRVHDLAGLDAWLASQLTLDPARGDLALRRVRVLIEAEQRDQAWALLDATLPKLPDGEGDDRLLALGRDLARANRGADAQQALMRLHTRRPARLDVTRELADACLAAGRRDQAEALFAADAQGRSLPDEVAAEQVLETVNFLNGKKLTVSASRLAEERLARDPGDFELRLASIRLLARLGDGTGAEKRMAETRVLADTAARYRRWLEVMIESTSVERRPDVLAAEKGALDREAGDWNEVQAARRAMFAEACIAADDRALATQVLRADLVVAPAGERVPLLRALATLLTGPEDVKQLRDTLTELADEDPTGAADALARRALIGVGTTRPNNNNPFSEGQPGSIPEGLQAIDPRQLSDLQVLDQCWTIFADGNASDKAVICAERLVQLEPANAARWERWCLSLAAVGDEEALRMALRRLLAGVENLVLKPEVRDQLQDALLASTWRSCARLTAGGKWQELLAAATEAESLTRTVQQGRWLAWSRCLALARLGRGQLADAIAELTRRCAGDPQIVFPDGLAITLTGALAQFTVASPTVLAAAERRGSLPPWRTAWAYTASGSIAGVLPSADAVLICVASGAVSALDPRTGRLLWRRENLVQAGKPVEDPSGNGYVTTSAVRLPVVVATGSVGKSGASGDLLIAVIAGEIVAHGTGDGAVRWRSSVIEEPAGVAVAGGVVVAWSDRDGACVGLDPLTGRVRWVLDLPVIADQGRNSPAASASEGSTVAILGKHGGIVDAVSGQLRWSASLSDVEASVPVFNGPQTPPAVASPPLVTNWRRRHSGMRRAVTTPVPAVAYISSSGGSTSIGYFNPAQVPTTRLVGGLLGIAMFGGESVPDIFAGQLIVSSPQGVGLVDLALPLAPSTLPPATPAGSWGHRLLLLQPNGATVRDLATGTDRDLDLAPLRRPAATVAANPSGAGEADESENQVIATLAMPIATMDGRLAWLAGPAGVAAYDLETGDQVAFGAWPTAIEPDLAAVMEDQRTHGVIIGKRLITPACGRVIVALERPGDGQ